MEIQTIRKPYLTNMKRQLESTDKEIKELEKLIEQLEIQKLTLEQRYIEQNYLSHELYQSHIPQTILEKEKLLGSTLSLEYKNLNEINNQSDSEDIQKDKNYDPSRNINFETQQIQGFQDEELSSQKLNLSPIDRSPQSSDEQSKNPNKDDICELKGFSQSLPRTEFVSTLSCFSPVELKNFEELNKNKINTPQNENLNKDKGEGNQKDKTSYLRKYQKKLVQKQHIHSKGNLNSNNNIGLETRTKSLPQPFHSGFANIQHTSPKESSGLLRSVDSQTRNLLSAQSHSKFQNFQNLQSQKIHFNFQSTISTKSFVNSIQKPSNDKELDESVSIFSPKALDLHINSLEVPSTMQGGVTSNAPLQIANEKSPLHKEKRKYLGNFSGDKARSSSSFVEEKYFKDKKEENEINEKDKKNNKKSKKRSLSVETSIYLEESDPFMVVQNKGETLNDFNFLNVEEYNSKLNKIVEKTSLGTRREHSFEEGSQNRQGSIEERKIIQVNERETNKLKFKGLKIDERKLNRKTNGNRSSENSQREGKGYLNIEDLDIKDKDTSLEHLRSPIECKISRKYLIGVKDIHDFKNQGRTNELPINEVLFFETVNFFFSLNNC